MRDDCREKLGATSERELRARISATHRALVHALGEEYVPELRGDPDWSSIGICRLLEIELIDYAKSAELYATPVADGGG